MIGQPHAAQLPAISRSLQAGLDATKHLDSAGREVVAFGADRQGSLEMQHHSWLLLTSSLLLKNLALGTVTVTG